jgi:glycosyltransferase involved in cell wall biosynthesis
LITRDKISPDQTQKRYRILFLSNWYPSHENPVEGIFVQEIIRAVSIFHSVVVVHNTGADPALDQPWKMELAENSSLTKGIKTYRFQYRPSPIPGTRVLLSALAFRQAYLRVIREEWVPDIIHAHVYHAGKWGAIFGVLARIPVVITEHSSAFFRDRLSRSPKLLTRFAFRIARVIVPVSTALKNAMVLSGITGDYQIVPNVVDDQVFAYKEKSQDKPKLKFLFVGLLDLSDNKGLEVLLQALERYSERDIKWHLDIIGDGPGRNRYQEYVSGSRLKELVTFHGMKAKSEVATFMSEADLFILPSLKETFSVATVEALATGTPVLATKCGGPEDFINPTNGILVEAGDPKALFVGLLRSIESLDSFDNERIARDARQKFSPHVVGEKYTKIYHKVLTGYQE